MNVLTLGKQTANLPDFVENRVAATNIVTVSLVLLIALPFFLISWYYAPVLMFLPGAGILTCLAVLIGNYFGYVRYTRFFISALPIWQVNVYNAYITESTAPPAANLYLVAIAFFIVPFVLIDRREKWFLSFTVGFCSLAILLFPWLSTWFALSPEEFLQIASYRDLLAHGWLSHLTAFLAIGAAASSMVGINEINRRSEESIQSSKTEVMAYAEQLEAEKKNHERKTEELEQAREEEDKRRWINSGVTQMIEILRQASDMNDAYDKALSGIVKYLDANQAGLFIVERQEEQATINLRSCYAYERKKFLHKSIAPGEGLLGQTYLEQVTMHLTEMPADYVRITSGLGQALPRNLLIVPMIVNEEVEGLLEIAAFKAWEAHHIELVEKVAQEIGGYSAKERIVSHTQSLLKQSQEQSEELRAAEEEMRQNQEELQSTQEEMMRQHAELREQSERREAELLAEIEALKTSSAGAIG